MLAGRQLFLLGPPKRLAAQQRFREEFFPRSWPSRPAVCQLDSTVRALYFRRALFLAAFFFAPPFASVTTSVTGRTVDPILTERSSGVALGMLIFRPPRLCNVAAPSKHFPDTSAFVGCGDTTLGEEFLDITTAESQPVEQLEGGADDLGWDPR